MIPQFRLLNKRSKSISFCGICHSVETKVKHETLLNHRFTVYLNLYIVELFKASSLLSVH